MLDQVGRRCFDWVHRRNLVYNSCWEDPRLDREALRIGPGDTICMITSAGCNALDYALSDPDEIVAVDVNPLQNALLELKIAGIRALEFEQFFELFGNGRSADWDAVYQRRLRPLLSHSARECWDRRGRLFAGSGRRDRFYFRGSSGLFAWTINRYLDRVGQAREAVQALLEADSVEEQEQIYRRYRIGEVLWKPLLKWLLRRDTTLALLGVPKSQRTQIEQTYPGGIVRFIQDRVEHVFTKLPIRDNYFWQVYLRGYYPTDCCPEYLKRENFQRLKAGLVDSISLHNGTLLDFLRTRHEPITRFVLLDHMDWLCNSQPELLAAEWQEFVNCSAANARLIWRSAGLTVDYVDKQMVTLGRSRYRVGDLLRYDRELADRLHRLDRVNTYGSFHIAEMSAV